jgi:hypothetical protein
MDGTFVKELAGRLQPEPRTMRLADGRELVFRPASGAWELLAEPGPKALQLHTLQGLVDYFAAGIDPVCTAEFMTHVVSPVHVEVRGPARKEMMGARECFAQVSIPEGTQVFQFGVWHPAELFVLSVQSLFVPTPERDELLTLVSKIRGGDVRETTDNGFSQEVKATKGVALVTNVVVTPRVTLRPYRTFREVEQPASDFVLRLRATEDQKPELLLAEADGGAWRLAAIEAVAAWLRAAFRGPAPVVVA